LIFVQFSIAVAERGRLFHPSQQRTQHKKPRNSGVLWIGDPSRYWRMPSTWMRRMTDMSKP
jgi:hypothetical protein